MTGPVRRRVRAGVPSAAAAALALLTLTGCTHASHDCSGGVCGVYLEGVGASIDIDANTLLGPGASGEVTIELTGLAAGSATFTVNGAEATCVPGDAQAVSELQVTCMEISADSMSMEVTG